MVISPKNYSVKPSVGAQINWGHSLSKYLTACWLLNEGAGAYVRDAAGQRHGTIAGLGGDFVWSQGQSGIALKSIVGTGANRITFPSLSVGVPFSWETRLKYTSFTDSWQSLFTQGGAYGIFSRASQLLRLEVSSGGLYSNSTMSANVWIHIVVTWDGSTAKIYFDGKEDASGAVPAFTAFTADGMLNDSVSETFDGICDYQRIWLNRTLAPSEVRQLYCNPYEMILPQSSRFLFPSASGSALTLSLSDSISFSDVRALGEAKALSDALSLADIRALGESKALSDTITLGQAVIKLAALTKSDMLTVADAMIRLTGKNLSNSITVGDAVSAFLILIKSVSNPITLSDSISTLLTAGQIPLFPILLNALNQNTKSSLSSSRATSSLTTSDAGSNGFRIT